MGKVYQDKKCDFCDFTGKVIETFGKKYCSTCYDKKPKSKQPGHSGMINHHLYIQDSLGFTSGIYLEQTTKGNPFYAQLYLEHYPQSKGIVGRQFNYFIKEDGVIIGIIGFNSPPLNYKKFNEYFTEQYDEKNWLNNNVFRLIKHQKNYGTRILKLARNKVKNDYENKYPDKLIGLITFVEPPRIGAIYKADNWDYLGETQGISVRRTGEHGKWLNKEYTKGTVKHIYGKKFKTHKG